MFDCRISTRIYLVRGNDISQLLTKWLVTLLVIVFFIFTRITKQSRDIHIINFVVSVNRIMGVIMERVGGQLQISENDDTILVQEDTFIDH